MPPLDTMQRKMGRKMICYVQAQDNIHIHSFSRFHMNGFDYFLLALCNTSDKGRTLKTLMRRSVEVWSSGIRIVNTLLNKTFGDRHRNYSLLMASDMAVAMPIFLDVFCKNGRVERSLGLEIDNFEEVVDWANRHLCRTEVDSRKRK